jgi:Rrf2 family protein
MAHLTASVEYGLHCLTWLVGAGDAAMSSRDLADLQGVSPSFLAKIFPRLERAGIVKASEGVRGGYQLARPAAQISLLEVIDAIEGDKPLFDCQEVRGRCALFAEAPPAWATKGVCAIHAAIIRAEKAMRAELAKTSLADIVAATAAKAPARFEGEVSAWIDARVGARAGRVGRARESPRDS